MSSKPKFKPGDRVRVKSMQESTKVGVVTGQDIGPYVWARFDDTGVKHVWEEDLELLAEPRRITSVDEIRTGAIYDLGGAQLTGQALEGIWNPHLRNADGNSVLDHFALERLFEAGVVVTELVPPEPETEWQPGDWVRDADDPQGAWYVFAPDSADEPHPHHWMAQKGGFYQRKELPARLTLAYRHEVES